MTTFNPRCKVCIHPGRDKVESLMKQGMPYREIPEVVSAEFPQTMKLVWTSLHRHKKHMIFFQVPGEAIQVKVLPVSSVPEVEITDAQLKDMADPNAWTIVNRTLNKLELIEKNRPLNAGEELLRQRYLDFLIKAEANEIAKRDVVKDQKQVEKESEGKRILEWLEARKKGVENGTN